MIRTSLSRDLADAKCVSQVKVGNLGLGEHGKGYRYILDEVKQLFQDLK